MNTEQLLDFLVQESIKLEVWDDPDEGCRVYDFEQYPEDHIRFVWYHGSLTVNVWICDENTSHFTINGAELSDALRGIKDYRTDKGE